MQRIRDCRILSPKLDIYITNPPSKPQGSCGKRGGKIVRVRRLKPVVRVCLLAMTEKLYQMTQVIDLTEQIRE